MIWPRRARCSPSLVFCNSVGPSRHPIPQSTKVGTSEVSADFRPNNYQRWVQQRKKARDPYGGGKSVPEPQRVKGFGCEIIIIGLRPQVARWDKNEFWSDFRPK